MGAGLLGRPAQRSRIWRVTVSASATFLFFGLFASMRTLIYKRTHHGDPDPETGEFGCNDCMGTVRCWKFDAVIGIGGIGAEPKRYGIAGKLTWIGIGARKIYDSDRRK